MRFYPSLLVTRFKIPCCGDPPAILKLKQDYRDILDLTAHF